MEILDTSIVQPFLIWFYFIYSFYFLHIQNSKTYKVEKENFGLIWQDLIKAQVIIHLYNKIIINQNSAVGGCNTLLIRVIPKRIKISGNALSPNIILCHSDSRLYVQFFIWFKYWRFGAEFIYHSYIYVESFHLGSLWFLWKLIKSTWLAAFLLKTYKVVCFVSFDVIKKMIIQLYRQPCLA